MLHAVFYWKCRAVLFPVNTFVKDKFSFSQPVDNARPSCLIRMWVDVIHRHGQQLSTGVPQIAASFLIHVQKAEGLRIDYLDGVVGLINQRPEKSQGMICRPQTSDVLQDARDPVNAASPRDREITNEQVPLAAIGILVAHFILHGLAAKGVVEPFLDGRLESFGVQYLGDVAANYVLLFHAPDRKSVV